MLGHSSLTLTNDQMDILWKLFVEEQLEAPLESEIMYFCFSFFFSFSFSFLLKRFKWLATEEDKSGYVLKVDGTLFFLIFVVFFFKKKLLSGQGD